VVFWVVSPYSVVIGYQSFRGLYCFLLQLLHPWRWRQHGSSECWYPTTTLRGTATQKTTNYIFTAM